MRGAGSGIEYIGPKTFRAAFRHEFIYTLDGVMELIAAIGTGNVGVMLDSWHLYTSGGLLSDLQRLTNDQDVVVVHVNDAPAGIPWDEQIDTVRDLPMETGVIDLVGFMRALQKMGYDGPVMPEPFSQRIDRPRGHRSPGGGAGGGATRWMRCGGLRVWGDGGRR